MRSWFDPAKLNSFQLTPVDVKNAIATQNVQISSGELGGLPSVEGQQLNATVIGPTRLTSIEAFRQILLRVNTDGSQVRLQDVARVAMGGESEAISDRIHGKPASGIACQLASGANALTTADTVRAPTDKMRLTAARCG